MKIEFHTDAFNSASEPPGQGIRPARESRLASSGARPMLRPAVKTPFERKAQSEVVKAASPELHAAVWEVVGNQLKLDQPPETRATFEWFRRQGHSERRADGSPSVARWPGRAGCAFQTRWMSGPLRTGTVRAPFRLIARAVSCEILPQ